MTSSLAPVPGADHRLARWRLGRTASAVVAVGSVAALAVFSLWPSSVRTSVTTSRSQNDAAPSAAAPSPAPATPALVAVDTSSPSVAAGSATTTAGASSTPGSTPATSPVSPGTGATPGPAPATASATCPLALPSPSQSGGLQSLVSFAPAFGPFASEAFALAPAYAPLLQLFGPLVAEFAAESTNGAAVVAPVLSVLGELDTAGFDVFEPLYGPERSQVLGYETQLASVLAPYSEELAASAPGACLVDLEGLLVTAGSSS